MTDPIVIASVARTPLGAFRGQLAALSAPQLGAVAIRAAVERAGIPSDAVQEVLMGCVLPAGVGQAPARQAALSAGLPVSSACTTVSKVCGSGMKAVMLAHDSLAAMTSDVTVAGGMESMSNAPYLLPKARGGLRLGHGSVVDHMFLDGLEDSYDATTRGRLMGSFAEDCAAHFGFTRGQQDAFAMESTRRARHAGQTGLFDWEIASLSLGGPHPQARVAHDEAPMKAQLDKIASLRPAFSKDGTVTAANSSSISDGAATLVLMRRSTADAHGVEPLATIVSQASHAQQPQWFTTAPAGAMRTALKRAQWSVEDVDLWEINEAFAVVTMAAMRELKLSHDLVNVHGGACALGHPIGASGARILVTLIGALRARGARRGMASLCIGGGEATAIALEMFGR